VIFKTCAPRKGHGYERYLRTEQLLSLQKPCAERLHPDEHTSRSSTRVPNYYCERDNELGARALQLKKKGDLQNAAAIAAAGKQICWIILSICCAF